MEVDPAPPPPAPAEVPRFTFPKSARLVTPAEFARVYARKRSAADARLIVYACEPPESAEARPRLGVSVSRKVGGAVLRNAYKRRFREAFRLVQHELPAVDLILIPRTPQKGTPPAEVEEYRAALLSLARQAAGRLSRRAEGRQPPVAGPGESSSQSGRASTGPGQQPGADAPRLAGTAAPDARADDP